LPELLAVIQLVASILCIARRVRIDGDRGIDEISFVRLYRLSPGCEGKKSDDTGKEESHHVPS